MRKIRPLWLWLIILGLLLVLIFETRLKTEEVHSKAEIPNTSKNFALFVPSPYELSMILAEKDIWPRRFGPKNPPEVSDMPLIYSTYLRKHKARRDEVDFFRSVAMTASLGEWETFKEVLSFRLQLDPKKLTPDSLLKWVKGEKCSSYGNEVGYRLAQWEPKKNAELREVFKKCDENSFHALWFEILTTVEANKPDQIAALRDRIQTRRQLMPNDSFEFFLLTQVFESLDIKLIHKK